MLLGLWPAMIRGEVLACQTGLKVMERQAKLLGLDSPMRVDVTATLRQIAEREGLPVEEVLAEAERVVREHAL